MFFSNSAASGPFFFLWFVLALSGGTPFPGPPLLRTASIRILLERNPPKASPRPGRRLRLLGERAIPLLTKKGTLMPNKYTQPPRENKNAAPASNLPVKTFRQIGR